MHACCFVSVVLVAAGLGAVLTAAFLTSRGSLLARYSVMVASISTDIGSKVLVDAGVLNTIIAALTDCKTPPGTTDQAYLFDALAEFLTDEESVMSSSEITHELLAFLVQHSTTAKDAACLTSAFKCLCYIFQFPTTLSMFGLESDDLFACFFSLIRNPLLAQQTEFEHLPFQALIVSLVSNTRLSSLLVRDERIFSSIADSLDSANLCVGFAATALATLMTNANLLGQYVLGNASIIKAMRMWVPKLVNLLTYHTLAPDPVEDWEVAVNCLANIVVLPEVAKTLTPSMVLIIAQFHDSLEQASSSFILPVTRAYCRLFYNKTRAIEQSDQQSYDMKLINALWPMLVFEDLTTRTWSAMTISHLLTTPSSAQHDCFVAHHPAFASDNAVAIGDLSGLSKNEMQLITCLCDALEHSLEHPVDIGEQEDSDSVDSASWALTDPLAAFAALCEQVRFRTYCATVSRVVTLILRLLRCHANDHAAVLFATKVMSQLSAVDCFQKSKHSGATAVVLRTIIAKQQGSMPMHSLLLPPTHSSSVHASSKYSLFPSSTHSLLSSSSASSSSSTHSINLTLPQLQASTTNLSSTSINNIKDSNSNNSNHMSNNHIHGPTITMTNSSSACQQERTTSMMICEHAQTALAHIMHSSIAGATHQDNKASCQMDRRRSSRTCSIQ
jgi:hypothetical protein